MDNGFGYTLRSFDIYTASLIKEYIIASSQTNGVSLKGQFLVAKTLLLIVALSHPSRPPLR
jgi:hypothetical protein